MCRWLGSGRWGVPSRRLRPAGPRLPGPGGAPHGRTTWTRQARSGGLRCATGIRSRPGFPESPGSGASSPAAGGHPRVVGPEALPAGGVASVATERRGHDRRERHAAGPAQSSWPRAAWSSLVGRSGGPARCRSPRRVVRKPGDRCTSAVPGFAMPAGGRAQPGSPRRERSGKARRAPSGAQRAACGRLEDVWKVLTGPNRRQCRVSGRA